MKEYKYKCKWCEEEFIAHTIRKKFCSKKCSEEYLFHQKERLERARFTIYERDQFKCVYCGRSPIEDSNCILTIDHVNPIYFNGESNLYNMVTCCHICNKDKGARILEDSVYNRIIERNKVLMGGISPIMQIFVESVFGSIKRKTKGKGMVSND
jgi:hypothetical protein